jgi:EAL domain-containing protein (putative c-di-GMP-specific phosphodiesterase class I)
MQWYLESMTDAGKEWLVNIASVPFVIGRADDCNLKLVDNRISRHHSELRISSDLLWIRDLQSTNGTLVNQARIEEAQLLEPNDIVSIGKYHFKVSSILSSADSASCETLFETHSGELKGLDASSLLPKLREIIQNRSVIPHFQPLLRFSDMANVGFEILGRVSDGSMPSNANELFDIAECLGCAAELSSLFREVGVETGKAIPGFPMMFVNTSRFEIFEMDNLLASMQKIRDMAPSNTVVLEINEKAAADTNELPTLRQSLEKLNIGLAFDDFGVGQTRLVELSKTPPDYLKFDISLIRKIHLAPKRLHQMISTFIKASHDLGILTLAEGIECSEESDVCQQIGFDFGQGYFFGKPTPIHAISSPQLPTRQPRCIS